MIEPKTDPCPPPAPECPFGTGCPAVQSLRDLILSEHENTRKTVNTLGARLDWVEAAGETTMAETVKAKLARAEDKAQLDMLTAVARKSGGESGAESGAAAGAIEARKWRSQSKSLSVAAAGFIVALTAALPQIVQACSGHAHAHAAPSVSR